MKKTLIALLLSFFCVLATAADKIPAHPYVEVVTTLGTFKLELDGRAAPYSVANFLRLVKNGYYDGTIFHRVIPGFMAQGGGYMPNLKPAEGDNGIPNESGNGLSNKRGTIAMARTGDPHSANAQFFLNVGDNSRLDPSKNGWGYAVFGQVIEGMDVVDKIVRSPTGPAGEFASDVPLVPIVITRMTQVVFE